MSSTMIYYQLPLTKEQFFEFEDSLTHISLSHFKRLGNKLEGELTMKFFDGPLKDLEFKVPTKQT